MKTILLLALLAACGDDDAIDDGGSDARVDAADDTGEAPACTLTCPRETNIAGEELCECRHEDDECATDLDCVVVTRADACCTCGDVVARSIADAEPCIVEPFELAPEECVPAACPDCAGDCAVQRGARCEEGRCVAIETCEEDEVTDSLGYCVPRCASDDDCVLGQIPGRCCGGCDQALHRETVEALTCVVPSSGETPRRECTDDPDQCAMLDCEPVPPESCPDVVVRCEDGMCVIPGS